MAAKILEDVLSNLLSIDSLFKWLSSQDAVNDVNMFINHYKCNQVEFASYFLNFLREQSSMVLQSSCTAETPSKGSQSRKVLNANYSPDRSDKSEITSASTEKKLDFKSPDSFPSLTELSMRSKSREKNTSKLTDTSSAADNSKKFQRVELFPGNNDNGQYHGFASENRNPAAVSTPKSCWKDHVDVADYFNDILILDGSPERSPGPRHKKDGTDKTRRSYSGVATAFKSSSPSGEPRLNARSRGSKINSRVILGDFILNNINSNDGKKEKKNKVRRRINPSRVNSVSPRFEDGSSFEISNSTFDNSDEREALKIERLGVFDKFEERVFVADGGSKDSSPSRVVSTPTKKSKSTIDSVTFAEELRLLSEIYSFIIDENYCQNVMIEYCFMISLLVVQDNDSDALETCPEINCGNDNYLGTVQNCVCFAVETLWLQRNVLALLNLAALKLLSENKQVEKFNSRLAEFLKGAYVERQGKESLKRDITDSKTSRLVLGNVSFECETDNKDNFTNDINFYSFRKQRDLFYNILETWEENHLTTGWKFSTNLDAKIRALLAINSDPTNQLHLARLFRCQLVMSCCGDYRAEDESNEEILQLLASVDPKKILRLRARLSSKPKRQGPCPLPDFTGHQEFFKDFIISTSYTVFHCYLKNSLCGEILRLNDAEFSSDQEDDDSCLDRQTQNRYFEQINVLCLLAKFLGFLEFLPYRNDKQLPDRVASAHCAVRQNLLPLFDLESCLKSAFARHKLTVTVPWIVNYLSMIDFCSARLKTYQKVWKMLVKIYRSLGSCKNLMNSFYLKLVLGWLFQSPNFPPDIFYNAFQDFNKSNPSELSIGFSAGLDSYNFIEENILYSICPYLSEINSILTENSGCSVKHIRPVTQGSTTTSSQTAKNLQLRLEESFLHNQSSSTRKTIEFVSERVSSVAVKHLINDVIPKVKEKALKEMEELFGESNEVDVISERCYEDLISVCEIESWHICSVRSEKSLPALLSLDLDSTVSETCVQIVVRQSAEKVRRWIQTHVTLAIIKKEFEAIVKKKNKKTVGTAEPSENWGGSLGADPCHKVQKPTPLDISQYNLEDGSISNIFILFREIMFNIYEGRMISWNEIDDAFEKALKIWRNALDITPAVEKTGLALALDLFIIICVRSQIDFRKDNFNHLLRYLRQLSEIKCPGNALERIICPRNIALFSRESKNNKKCWENLGNIFLFLMEEELLTQDQVEAQLLSLLKQNWKKEDSDCYTALISKILNRYTDKNGCDKFTLLLEYLMETLCDSDDSKTQID